MKYKGTMLIVKDMENSKNFYTTVLGVRVISDFGENITLTGGLSLQTEQSWCTFTHCSTDFFRYQGNVAELYFEEENFDEFLIKLHSMEVPLLDKEMTMPWGQKVVRFYDPDKHIIEVGEDLKVMMKRLHKDGLTVEELVEKTFMSKGIIERMLNK